MALRVLLADESSTIKKVFQLSLQDYAVEVCAVTIGLDVLTVSQQFKPDIVFCDILLQKRSGYEVCAELKNDPALTSVPVVLMWSGFMELDEDRLQAARADAHLEKPFEANDLRKLVNQLVPKTRTQRLSSFLTFPKMPEMIDAQAKPGPASGGLETHGNWNMESFDPIPDVHAGAEADPGEEFQEVPLPPPPKPLAAAPTANDEVDDEITDWSPKNLEKFRVEAPADVDDDLGVRIVEQPQPAPQRTPPLPATVAELELELAEDEVAVAQNAALSQPPPAMSAAEVERIVRTQSQAVIEAIVWKVVPDLATQIIERELKRLLAEKSSSPQV